MCVMHSYIAGSYFFIQWWESSMNWNLNAYAFEIVFDIYHSHSYMQCGLSFSVVYCVSDAHEEKLAFQALSSTLWRPWGNNRIYLDPFFLVLLSENHFFSWKKNCIIETNKPEPLNNSNENIYTPIPVLTTDAWNKWCFHKKNQANISHWDLAKGEMHQIFSIFLWQRIAHKSIN